MDAYPDLTARPLALSVERNMKVSAAVFYRAWTAEFDSWFAAPGIISMIAEVDAPFFFEARFNGERHPHYGRFLALEPDERIEITWLTGDPGTKGAETVLNLNIEPAGDGCKVVLEHSGFLDEATRDGHEEAWPQALEHLDNYFSAE